jgi:hypothetical protein
MNETPIPSNMTLIDFWNTIQGKTYGENLTIDYGRLLAWFETAFSFERQLTTVTEQRDRLAEALRECSEDSVELLGERDCCNDPADAEKRYQETCDNVTRADEALQSLTPNEL